MRSRAAGVQRVSALSAVLAVGALSLAAAAHQGQQPPAGIVRMQTLNVRDILYELTGGGGNTLALMREEGVVLIDTKLPGWGRPVLDAIEAVTDKPVVTIINTHAHADHTGGNVDFPTATQIVAHENTKANMQKMEAFTGSNARFLPNRTVTDRMSLLDGPDRIDLYYFGAGHTNGDLVVVFPEKHLALFGDLFPSKAAPVIDTANGGSAVAFPRTLARAVAEIRGVTRVITGHDESRATPRDPKSDAAILSMSRTMAWSDVEEYADFNRDFLAAVRELLEAGKSADEAAANLKLPDRYTQYDMQRARANVEAIYRELKQ
jgi:glyoxylase-like metal-dependent hydrolase (beta-lactamase superfamily II)